MSIAFLLTEIELRTRFVGVTAAQIEQGIDRAERTVGQWLAASARSYAPA
jgi:hypothetical protein